MEIIPADICMRSNGLITAGKFLVNYLVFFSFLLWTEEGFRLCFCFIFLVLYKIGIKTTENYLNNWFKCW